MKYDRRMIEVAKRIAENERKVKSGKPLRVLVVFVLSIPLILVVVRILMEIAR